MMMGMGHLRPRASMVRAGAGGSGARSASMTGTGSAAGWSAGRAARSRPNSLVRRPVMYTPSRSHHARPGCRYARRRAKSTITRLGFPPPITRQGETVLTLWQGSWIAGLAVGVLVWGLILWAVIFHRKRGDRLPPQARYNTPIEIMFTSVPFVLIAVLFYFTA